MSSEPAVSTQPPGVERRPMEHDAHYTVEQAQRYRDKPVLLAGHVLRHKADLYAARGETNPHGRMVHDGLDENRQPGRIPFRDGRGGIPEDKEAWGDADYGVSMRGNVRCCRVKKNGKRCSKWAMHGSIYCRWHFGKTWRDKHPNMSHDLLSVISKNPKLGRFLSDGLSAREIDAGWQEAVAGRAITAASLDELRETWKDAPAESAAYAMELLKRSQALVLGHKAMQLRADAVLTKAQLYYLINGFVGVVSSIIVQQFDDEEQANQVMRQIAAGIMSLEIDGHMAFGDVVDADEITALDTHVPDAGPHTYDTRADQDERLEDEQEEDSERDALSVEARRLASPRHDQPRTVENLLDIDVEPDEDVLDEALGLRDDDEQGRTLDP